MGLSAISPQASLFPVWGKEYCLGSCQSHSPRGPHLRWFITQAGGQHAPSEAARASPDKAHQPCASSHARFGLALAGLIPLTTMTSADL